MHNFTPIAFDFLLVLFDYRSKIENNMEKKKSFKKVCRKKKEKGM